MLSKKEQKRLMCFCHVKIHQNPLTKKFYWAQHDFPNGYYASDGFEYQTRTQAINAFFKFAVYE